MISACLKVFTRVYEWMCGELETNKILDVYLKAIPIPEYGYLLNQIRYESKPISGNVFGFSYTIKVQCHFLEHKTKTEFKQFVLKNSHLDGSNYTTLRSLIKRHEFSCIKIAKIRTNFFYDYQIIDVN
jgi:hypothetical protein